MRIYIWSTKDRVVVVTASTFNDAKDLAYLEGIPEGQMWDTWYNITDDCDEAVYVYPMEIMDENHSNT